MRRSSMNAEADFTLIELLIALALLAVIVSLLVNAVGSARHALNVVDLRVTQASVPAVQSVLRRLRLEARPNIDGMRHVVFAVPLGRTMSSTIPILMSPTTYWVGKAGYRRQGSACFMPSMASNAASLAAS